MISLFRIQTARFPSHFHSRRKIKADRLERAALLRSTFYYATHESQIMIRLHFMGIYEVWNYQMRRKSREIDSLETTREWECDARLSGLDRDDISNGRLRIKIAQNQWKVFGTVSELFERWKQWALSKNLTAVTQLMNSPKSLFTRKLYKSDFTTLLYQSFLFCCFTHESSPASLFLPSTLPQT